MLENNGRVCKCWGCGKDYYNYDIMNNFYCDDCRRAMGIKETNATTQVEIQDLGFGVIKETYKRDSNPGVEVVKEMAKNVERAAVSIDELWEKLDKEHPGWRERGVEQLCDKNRKLTEQNEKLKKKVKKLKTRIEELEDKDFYEALIKQFEEQVSRLIDERDTYKIALDLSFYRNEEFLTVEDILKEAKESLK